MAKYAKTKRKQGDNQVTRETLHVPHGYHDPVSFSQVVARFEVLKMEFSYSASSTLFLRVCLFHGYYEVEV